MTLIPAKRLRRAVDIAMLNEHSGEDLDENSDHNRIACKFVELRVGNSGRGENVNHIFGNVHQAETLARSEFAYPILNDGEVIVLPL